MGRIDIITAALGKALATRLADAIFARGVDVIGFSYPFVAQGKARIRTQKSATHTREDLARALVAFIGVKNELGL